MFSTMKAICKRPPIGCDYKRFRSIPLEIYDRKNEELLECVGSYDSIFKKPEMWHLPAVVYDEDISFEKDVHRIIWRLLRRSNLVERDDETRSVRHLYEKV
ncbi:hypothetical protein NPIL_315821 [Nephila pilipes]|uniref:Uncharacterized protein n=1 Tax=Nephila pilipes TaxID=299642 RepID=A0A8X6T979_NEPPI|nr:hypothetical protein NPIL_315821 [Nephila pilipes]